MKMTAKDVKEITYMPLITFFSVLERPGKNLKGVQQPPLVRRGVEIAKFEFKVTVHYNLMQNVHSCDPLNTLVSTC